MEEMIVMAVKGASFIRNVLSIPCDTDNIGAIAGVAATALNHMIALEMNPLLNTL